MIRIVFTNVGVARIIEYLRGQSPNTATHIASGTDSTSATTSDTALGSEKINKAIGTNITYTDTTITFSILLESDEANGNVLAECGVFDAATSGNMFSRFTHTGVTKNSATEIEYSITFRITN